MNTPKTRFVVYGQGRSGSSLLLDLMRSHPDVHCDAEIFNQKAAGRLLSPGRYIEARASLSGKPAYGCKLKIYELTQDQGMGDPQAFLAGLSAGGWKLIYLSRRNLFRKSLSLVVAEARGGKFIDRRGDGRLRLQPLTIDPQRVVKVMLERQAHDRIEFESLGSLHYLPVTFEDDLRASGRHQGTCDRIFDFLGLPSTPVSTRLVRTSPVNVKDYVLNYDELVSAIEDAGFSVQDPH